MIASLLVIVPEDTKRHHFVGRFLRDHALGLSARMVEVINNTSPVPPPMRERKLCIQAMEEMIISAKGYIRTARPQVCEFHDYRNACITNSETDISLPLIRSSCGRTEDDRFRVLVFDAYQP